MKQKADLITNRISDPTDRLLTLSAVAGMCQCSTKTVRRWMEEGRISYIVLGQGTKYSSVVRIRESALIAFWKQAERKAI